MEGGGPLETMEGQQKLSIGARFADSRESPVDRGVCCAGRPTRGPSIVPSCAGAYGGSCTAARMRGSSPLLAQNKKEGWESGSTGGPIIVKKGVNKKAKALWSIADPTANGEAYYDRNSERQIESRTAGRQALWEAHMKSPTAALKEALKRTEGAGRAQSSAAGGSEVRATIV